MNLAPVMDASTGNSFETLNQLSRGIYLFEGEAVA
jgi:hypothetical protein